MKAKERKRQFILSSVCNSCFKCRVSRRSKIWEKSAKIAENGICYRFLAIPLFARPTHIKTLCHSNHLIIIVVFEFAVTKPFHTYRINRVLLLGIHPKSSDMHPMRVIDVCDLPFLRWFLVWRQQDLNSGSLLISSMRKTIISPLVGWVKYHVATVSSRKGCSNDYKNIYV